MIRFEQVSITYQGAAKPALEAVNFQVFEGEFALVAGSTGTGKSTLLGAVNGHVPQFTGGTFSGRVYVAGRDTREHPPRALAQFVGRVGQDPLAGFVSDTVEEELAYGMEQQGVSAPRMRTRVEETLDLLGIAELRDRPLLSLSGGQQQRVAIGSVLASGARVLVLDEPTSALDPTSAEEVLAALLRLVHDLGVTVLIAEHRLERVAEYADKLILLPGGGQVIVGELRELLVDSPLAPPVIHLGRALDWQPLPVSVRDARRFAAPLRDQLAECDPDDFQRFVDAVQGVSPLASLQPLVPSPLSAATNSKLLTPNSKSSVPNAKSLVPNSHSLAPSSPPVLNPKPQTQATPFQSWASRISAPQSGAQAEKSSKLRAHGITVYYGTTRAVRNVDLTLPAGQITVLLGRNGSGKSSLLWALTGAGMITAGRFYVDQKELTNATLREVRGLVRMVPQTAADLLYLDTVAAECAVADRSARCEGACRKLLDTLVSNIPDTANPRDLSEGQKLCLALAVQLVCEPAVILLDEPTRGLDYNAKQSLAGVIRVLAAKGKAIALATHDVEFAAAVADRAIVMSQGEVIASGTAREVLATSAIFSPQVSRVLSPTEWLTVDQVCTALAGSAGAK